MTPGGKKDNKKGGGGGKGAPKGGYGDRKGGWYNQFNPFHWHYPQQPAYPQQPVYPPPARVQQPPIQPGGTPYTQQNFEMDAKMLVHGTAAQKKEAQARLMAYGEAYGMTPP